MPAPGRDLHVPHVVRQDVLPSRRGGVYIGRLEQTPICGGIQNIRVIRIGSTTRSYRQSSLPLKRLFTLAIKSHRASGLITPSFRALKIRRRCIGLARRGCRPAPRSRIGHFRVIHLELGPRNGSKPLAPMVAPGICPSIAAIARIKQPPFRRTREHVLGACNWINSTGPTPADWLPLHPITPEGSSAGLTSCQLALYSGRLPVAKRARPSFRRL